MEEAVEAMETYNSVDKQGMDSFLQSFKSQVYKTLFPGEKRESAQPLSEAQFQRLIKAYKQP